MKKLVREYDFSPEQLNQVRGLARALSLTETTASLLFARGMDTEEKMRVFLSPSKEHFLSPFLLKGMREATELLTRARDEEWRVAIYGDYDADGIGACAILSRALRMFGIEPYVFVPERAQGYGMSVSSLDSIFDEFLPDLIVTVDCGISNADEVEYIKEQGAYVIVTDHHELPERLPDCIVVNPKLGGDYPYDNLCGAGVAFKLACALIGERAYPLADFAALSTVADSVPLLGENRDIVAEGLRLIEQSPRPAFAALLGRAGGVSAQTLAFTVAPRLNAAGRMGDANAALRLFTTEREEEIAPLAEKLNLYNAERQRYCDEVYAQASERIRREGAFGNVVMLAGDTWNAGFVGIVAARIAEEFSRPALLFVRRGDMLRGSARSVENVNIFEALKNCSEYIEEFGGHSQAAGVNIKAENFGRLKEALDKYLGEKYPSEAFVPALTVCGGAREDPARLAAELERLEPYGMGNRRPLFTLEAGAIEAAPIKTASPHLSFTADGMDFMYFNGIKDRKILRSDVKKTLVYEYNLSVFRGKESLKGFVRAVITDGTSGKEVELDAFGEQLLSLGGGRGKAEYLGTAETEAFLEKAISSCAYGLVAVCSDRKNLLRYPALKGLPVDVFRPSASNLFNTVLFAPEAGCDLSAYRDVVFLDEPAAFGAVTGNARVLCNRELCGYGGMLHLDVSRGALLEIYAAVRNLPLGGENFADVARAARGLGYDDGELVFALSVFDELGLVSLENGRLRVFRGIRTELAASRIYSEVSKLTED